MEQTNEGIAQTLQEMETVFVDGEKAHTDAILRARMREAHCTLAHHVATERVAETEATLRETEQLLSESLKDCYFGA